MDSVLDEKSLEQAFQGRADIQAAVRQAAAAGPAYIELFNQISLYVCGQALVSSSEPSSKKRRLEEDLPNRAAQITTNGQTAANGSKPARATIAIGNDPVLIEIKDISLVVPQRKKYTLCFTPSYLYARLPDSTEPVAGISYAWKDIDYAFCLPVPEKSQKQYNYILFPSNSTITPNKPPPGSPPIPEPLVFTIPDTPPKPGSISGLDSATASTVSDTIKTLFDWALSTRLKAASSSRQESPVKITHADEKLFHSMQRQPQRPGEKAVHVKAFRGSKDGYLFFLATGILWGFKKPLLFLPHERIAAVSYTSVLQRTFNLAVEVDHLAAARGVEGEEEETREEFEFSMLDQEDFAGIDAFVKRHGLQDKSMAEQRRAKRMNVNVVKDGDGNVIGNVEAGELERAAAEAGQQHAVDEEEEEEEEDYDPGSEGESEGEGSSSEEDDDDDDDDSEGGGDVEEGDDDNDDDDNDDDDDEAEREP